jgi:hypothetical protein
VQPPATVAVVMGWAVREPTWERYLGLGEALEDVVPAV